ncbi:MAG: hypothetical protein KJ558_09980 [Gammaproteobacteria bacterium]|nr:hypothetical protein [Gammaproteobacteria bacterium]MBU1655134.1 hypothetical protein [Gammaproteobacteria bacterium]MBU1962100.1 hypothetical protein [Gammaproteobacteria bacterium]
MSHHSEPPLFIDISDRRCRRAYLLAAHLAGFAGALITSVASDWALALFPLVAWCAHYWWRREQEGPHPHVLKWNPSLGWRLAFPMADQPVKALRHLELPGCLLLEARTERGLELLFLRDRPGMNRLRYRLRQSAET